MGMSIRDTKTKQVLFASKNGFDIYFDANDQIYNVFKDGRFIISGYKYSQVKTYVA